MLTQCLQHSIFINVDDMSTQNIVDGGENKMVDTQYLENLISLSGVKKTYIAECLGCTIQTLRRKITGESDFTMKEADVICSCLGITKLSDKEKIFNKK